jgi:hypothetical protein
LQFNKRKYRDEEAQCHLYRLNRSFKKIDGKGSIGLREYL